MAKPITIEERPNKPFTVSAKETQYGLVVRATDEGLRVDLCTLCKHGTICSDDMFLYCMGHTNQDEYFQ